MKLSGIFLKYFFLIFFSMYLSGSGALIQNEAMADDLSKSSSRDFNYSQTWGERIPFSNIVLSQAAKTENNSTLEEKSSEKLPWGLALGYSAWYSDISVSAEGGKGNLSILMHGPSISYSLGKWSLSGSFLMSGKKGEIDAITPGTGSNGLGVSNMHTEFDRYEADILLRRSFGFGNWLLGPQVGFKYLGIKNYNATVENSEFVNGPSTIYHGEGYLDAYGPSLGGVIAFIPGNPKTSPVTISLIANALYLKVKGKDPNAPLYTSPTNIRNAGYDPSITYYGLDVGSVPVYEVDTWTPGYNATLQLTYNIVAGLNMTAGARYNYAKVKNEYYQDGIYPVPSLAYFEYWGGFLNLSYVW